jgi:hypothetical protein
MNVLHIAVLKKDHNNPDLIIENPDLIKLLLHYGVDHQVCCIYEQVSSYIVY